MNQPSDLMYKRIRVITSKYDYVGYLKDLTSGSKGRITLEEVKYFKGDNDTSFYVNNTEVYIQTAIIHAMFEEK